MEPQLEYNKNYYYRNRLIDEAMKCYSFLTVVKFNFNSIVYNVTEGMSAMLQLVLSTTSIEDVTVSLVTVDGSTSG